MAQHAPQTLVLAGVAILLLAMTMTEGTLTILPGLLLMTAGGLWDAVRTREQQENAQPHHEPVNFGRAELRQSRT